MVSFRAINRVHKKIMYKDICNIYEFVAIKSTNGATQTKKTKKPIYENVPCKVSFSLRTWDTFTHKAIDTTPYEKQPKIFLDVEYTIRPGYYFEVARFNDQTGEKIFECAGQCGLPQVLWSHQEVLLDVRGNA